MLGKLAVHQFLTDGYSVRALVRNLEVARRELPAEAELTAGDITQPKSVATALKNIDYVHISVNGGNDADNIFQVEYEGVKNVIEIVEKENIQRLTYISGMGVNNANLHYPSERAKFMVEELLQKSSFSYTVFKPGFFMETLPQFVMKDKALMLGKQPHLFRLIAAHDLMRNISASYQMEAASNKVYYVFGNRPYLLEDALKQYIDKFHSGIKISVMPLGIMKSLNRFFMGGKLTRVLGIMTLMQEKGEEGDPTEYFRLFGEHPTTFEQWLDFRKNEG